MSEIIFSGIVNAGVLQDYVDVFTPLVQEGLLEFSEEMGLRCDVAEPGNVGIIDPARLHPEAFEHLDVPGRATMGVSWVKLDERLKHANSDDLVELELDMETRMLKIQYRNITHSIALIDPNQVRDNPYDPDLALPNTLTLTGTQLTEAVKVIEQVSDQVILEARPEDRQVVFIGEGDTDDTELEFGDEETVEADVPEDSRSIISQDYMEDVVKPMPNDAEIQVAFSEAQPVTFDWEMHDGNVTVHQMLAPRVGEDT